MRIWETRESRKIGKLEIGKPKETGNAGIEGGKIRERRTKKRKDREMESRKCLN